MDPYWDELDKFLKSLDKSLSVHVPEKLAAEVPAYRSYHDAAGLKPGHAVLALHKGQTHDIDPKVLFEALVHGRVMFANDVFVVIGPGAAARADLVQTHVPALVDALARTLAPRPADPEPTAAPPAPRQAIYLGNETLLTTLTTGEKIYLDAADISLTPHIALDGYWETWITRAFLAAIQPGMRVVDVGANCGYYTLLACTAVGPTGSVVAIDANPRMTALVENSLSVNGFRDRARAINAAVLDSEGTVSFAVPRRYKGSATYMRSAVDFSTFGDTHDLIEVPAAPLDRLIGEQPVDVMKIDAEGAEPLILRGSLELFRRAERLSLFMEFAPAFFEDVISGSELLDQLESVGFSASIIDSDGQAQPANRDQILGPSYCDLLLEKR